MCSEDSNGSLGLFVVLIEVQSEASQQCKGIDYLGIYGCVPIMFIKDSKMLVMAEVQSTY